jgi:hypothetical protein
MISLGRTLYYLLIDSKQARNEHHDISLSQETFRFPLTKRLLDNFSVLAWLEGHFALL